MFFSCPAPRYIYRFFVLIMLQCAALTATTTWATDRVPDPSQAFTVLRIDVSKEAEASPSEVQPTLSRAEKSPFPIRGDLVGIPFTAPNDGFTFVEGDSITAVNAGHAVVLVRIHGGVTITRISAVDARGQMQRFNVKIIAKPLALSEAPPIPASGGRGAVPPNNALEVSDLQLPPDAKGFWVVGPTVYAHSITRSGSAAVVPGTSGSFLLGVRGIYRRRILRDLTEHLPGKKRMFFDLSGTLGKTVSGDSGAQSLPVSLDARATVEIFEYKRARFELGAGALWFHPGLSTPQAGDVENFAGVVISGRIGYPLSDSLFGLLGLNIGIPALSTSPSNTLVSQTKEAFLALSIPRGEDGFYEFRLRYFSLNTDGTVTSSGGFSRSETFVGPEFLWSQRF